MKRRTFTIMAALFFVSSIFNLNAKSNNKILLVDSYECWDVADATVAAFQAENLKLHRIATYEDEFNIWDAAYHACGG